MSPPNHSDILLQGSSLSKNFVAKGQAPVAALADVSLTVKAGQITGLVGADGAGKTTLLRLAAGLLVPTAGELSFMPSDRSTQPGESQSQIGYMPQQFGLYQDLTVQENLDFFADLQEVPVAIRRDRFTQLLEMTDLKSFTERRAGQLSGGMKQKLGLACALIKSPPLLLLDEPTVGVDPVSRRDLWDILVQLIEQDGIGVLLATSYLDEADHCHQVIVMQDGRVLVRGRPEEFRAKMRGRVYRFHPNRPEETRQLQAILAARSEVLDATIRSGWVRAVLSEECSVPAGQLLPAERYQKVADCDPSFEDAFMALAAPSGVSFLANPTAKQENLSEEIVVHTRDLKKVFGDFAAVSGISFEVGRGRIFGLLGPNGAGKTTTFRMLCGLTKVSDGEISVAGHDLRHARARARADLGYMAQVFSLYQQLSVLDNLKFYGQSYGLSGQHLRERIDWALDEFELGSRQNMPAGHLPGGYRQRLAMATAMLHEPAILFLDEPTSGADPLARREFWLRINGFAQQGVTVIVTTHFMEEAEYCDRLLIMSRGTDLAQGTPDEIRSLAKTPQNPEPTIEEAFIALAESQSTSETGGHS